MTPRFGGPGDVAWIQEATKRAGLTIGAAIPPGFAAFATVTQPDLDTEMDRQDRELARLLRTWGPDGPWWFGYLDSGAVPLPHPDGPRVRLYANWPYVLEQGEPDEILSRRDPWSWKGAMPDLVFPPDRSWLVSTLWDDDWRCVGGPTGLVDSLVAGLGARAVGFDEDATPPGRTAR